MPKHGDSMEALDVADTTVFDAFWQAYIELDSKRRCDFVLEELTKTSLPRISPPDQFVLIPT